MFKLRTMNKLFFVLFFLVIIISFQNCKNPATENNTDESSEVTTEEKLDSNHISLLGKLDQLIKRFPLPTEIITSLFNTRALYNPEDLNKVSNISRYTTSYSKAFNIGIYATDLIYTIRYEQPQSALTYLDVTKKLSDEIGVTNVFNEKILSRFEENIDEKDSLLFLSYMTFSDLKKMLRSNEQIELSLMVVSGIWFEGLHISTSNFTESKIDDITNELVDNIYNHKNQVELIINILKDVKSEDVYLNKLYNDLKNIDTFFKNVEKEGTINKDEISKLSLIVKDLRLKYIL